MMKNENSTNHLVVPKQILLLFISIAVSAFIIVVFIDLVLFPVIMFAVNNKELFTSLVKIFSIAGLIIMVVYGVLYRMVSLKRKGFTPGSIARHFIARPGRYFLISLAVLFLFFLLVGFLYILFHGNHLLLYQILH